MNMKIRRMLPLLMISGSFALVSFIPLNDPDYTKEKTRSASKRKGVYVRTSPSNPYYIVIDKSDYELKVYDDEGWYATYPIVFGSNDLGDKMREGDKKTPNGTFKVIQKRINPKWGPQMLLDYPTRESYSRFNERKARGVLPSNAKIGSGIAIHSTRPQEEWAVDNYYNWTDGCVSVKYSEMKDLYSFIPVGTVVTIQP